MLPQAWGAIKVASLAEGVLKAELDVAKEAFEATKEVYGAGAGAGAASQGAGEWAGDDE